MIRDAIYSWYSRFHASIYDPFTCELENRFLSRRRKDLLANLDGTILEVGAGTGANFRWYPAEAQVLAVEPSGAMLRKAANKQKESPANIQLIHAAIEDPALEQLIPKEGIDAVVFTLVLCTVVDPEKVLDKAIRWLRPGGKICVLEHIVSEEPRSSRIQHWINPCWNVLADGCHLTRQTDKIFQSKELKPIWQRYDKKGLRFYSAVFQV